MRTLNRDKKPLYICKRIQDSDPVQFEKPIFFKLNIVSTSSEMDIVGLGDSYKEYLRAKVSINDVSKFNEGDRAYIYTAPPQEHDALCNGADFQITSVSKSVSEATIMFKRLQIGK